MGDIAIFLDNLRWLRISTRFPNLEGRDSLRWHELMYCAFACWPAIVKALINGERVPVYAMIMGKPMSKQNRQHAAQQVERLNKLYP